MSSASTSSCKVLANDERAHRWLCEAIGIHLHMDQSTSIAFVDDDGLRGGWLLEKYTGPGGSVHAHFAGARPGWITRPMLRVLANYIFVQLDCSCVFGQVNSKDTQTRSIDERLGFREVATLPNYFPDSDLIVYQMKRSDCRWLPLPERGV